MQTLITVAICTRNRVALFEKTVCSVLSQAEEKPIEILIVDNGSTDHTARVAAEFAAADPRVKFFHEPQPGLSIARNLALRHAAGEWVILLDDDATVEAGWLAAYEFFFPAAAQPACRSNWRPGHSSIRSPPAKMDGRRRDLGTQKSKTFLFCAWPLPFRVQLRLPASGHATGWRV